MPGKAIYARIQKELFDKLKTYAYTTGQSTSASVDDLVQRGLVQLSCEALTETLKKELSEQRVKVQELENKNAVLQGSLEACRAREAIAIAAQSHALALKQETEALKHQSEQLRDYLLTPVASCRNCHTQIRIFDIGQRKCARCDEWNPDWLPQFKAPPTGWEMLRDGVAVVAAATIVVALLNALSGEPQK
jgi:hypothetical protein